VESEDEASDVEDEEDKALFNLDSENEQDFEKLFIALCDEQTSTEDLPGKNQIFNK